MNNADCVDGVGDIAVGNVAVDNLDDVYGASSIGGIGDIGDLNAIDIDDSMDSIVVISGKNGMANIADIGNYKSPFEKRHSVCQRVIMAITVPCTTKLIRAALNFSYARLIRNSWLITGRFASGWRIF